MLVKFDTADFRLGDEGELFITVRNAGSMGWQEMSTCIIDETGRCNGGTFIKLQELIHEAIKKKQLPPKVITNKEG